MQKEKIKIVILSILNVLDMPMDIVINFCRRRKLKNHPFLVFQFKQLTKRKIYMPALSFSGAIIFLEKLFWRWFKSPNYFIATFLHSLFNSSSQSILESQIFSISTFALVTYGVRNSTRLKSDDIFFSKFHFEYWKSVPMGTLS